MLITQLIRKNSRMIIVFDTGEDLTIHYDIFLNNGLRRGDELSEADILSLKNQSDLLYAKESALRLLGRRIHSAKELSRKLYQKKYSGELIQKVIEDLTGAGYLDDLAFAKQYSAEKISRRDGVQKIRSELMARGVAREIISEALGELDHDLEKENALKAAEKKAAQLKARGVDQQKLKQKLYAFLLSKGYEFELIREIVDKVSDKNTA